MSISDFETIRELGKGSFGSVFLVKRKADNSLYAMKRVIIGSMTQKEKENSLNEVRLLASIKSKYVIAYKEAFFDEKSQSLNIIMEYADDEDLEKKIKSKAKSSIFFTEEEIWTYLIQMIIGINVLHSKSVMHRDLKSANIFLNRQGQVKIGDLNVGKFIKDNKLALTQTGTPYYASPEVWADVPYSFKSDLWSVGCIIYEMTSLTVPFKGENLSDLYESVTKGEYQSIPSRYSSELNDLIKRLLQVKSEKRLDSWEVLEIDYVKRRIESYIKKNGRLEGESNEEFISTIKVPFNLNEINRLLPKMKYSHLEKENGKEKSYRCLSNCLSSNAVSLKLKKTHSSSTIECSNIESKEGRIGKKDYDNHDPIENIMEIVDVDKEKDKNKISIKPSQRLIIKGIKPSKSPINKTNLNRNLSINCNIPIPSLKKEAVKRSQTPIDSQVPSILLSRRNESMILYTNIIPNSNKNGYNSNDNLTISHTKQSTNMNSNVTSPYKVNKTNNQTGRNNKYSLNNKHFLNNQSLINNNNQFFLNQNQTKINSQPLSTQNTSSRHVSISIIDTKPSNHLYKFSKDLQKERVFSQKSCIFVNKTKANMHSLSTVTSPPKVLLSKGKVNKVFVNNPEKADGNMEEVRCVLKRRVSNTEIKPVKSYRVNIDLC